MSFGAFFSLFVQLIDPQNFHGKIYIVLFSGSDAVADEYSNMPMMRAKHWVNQNYGSRKCGGEIVRGICVYGVNDLPWLHQRPELFANKFYLTREYLAYDCLEERHRNRTKERKVANDFKAELYRNVPTVLYSRKDGVPPNEVIV